MKKLIECNKDRHCPKTLPKCHEMDRPTFSGKKGYCVFRTCQYCQKKRNCPTIGPPLCPMSSPNGPGGLEGSCNAHLNTCEYSPLLVVAGCRPGITGKVKTALKILILILILCTYECLGHQCVEDSPCDVLGTQNECPNGVCYEG